MPRKLRATVSLGRLYSSEDMGLIRLGHYPAEMGDHWFMYFKDDTLFVHRSWTGYCIYAIRFALVEDGYLMLDAVVNRNPKQYRETDDAVDAREIPVLIDEVLFSF